METKEVKTVVQVTCDNCKERVDQFYRFDFTVAQMGVNIANTDTYQIGLGKILVRDYCSICYKHIFLRNAVGQL